MWDSERLPKSEVHIHLRPHRSHVSVLDLVQLRQDQAPKAYQTSGLGGLKGVDFVHSTDDRLSSGHWRDVPAHSVRQGWNEIPGRIG